MALSIEKSPQHQIEKLTLKVARLEASLHASQMRVRELEKEAIDSLLTIRQIDVG